MAVNENAEKPIEVWGVLNVTPDSFSDGGSFFEPAAACRQVERMLCEGADVIDIGGQSTRPRGSAYGAGAAPVSVEEELRRIIPAIIEAKRLGAKVSVDTQQASVAVAALERGADIVNDVSCGRSQELIKNVALGGAELVLMHSRDTFEARSPYSVYKNIVADVLVELGSAYQNAVALGVAKDKLWIDPGLGFSKTPNQSIVLLANIRKLVETGIPVLIGASRKSWIAHVMTDFGMEAPLPQDRLGGSLAAVGAAYVARVRAVRVHDVAATVQYLRVLRAIGAA